MPEHQNTESEVRLTGSVFTVSSLGDHVVCLLHMAMFGGLSLPF